MAVLIYNLKKSLMDSHNVRSHEMKKTEKK